MQFTFRLGRFLLERCEQETDKLLAVLSPRASAPNCVGLQGLAYFAFFR